MIKQIDVWGFRTPFLFLEWIGMNSMLVFVMAAEGIFAGFINGWYYEDPNNSLVRSKKKKNYKNILFPLYIVCLNYHNFLICFHFVNENINQVHWIKKHVFVNVWKSERVGSLLYVIFAEITFWGVVAGVLHKLKIYWKL